MSAITARPKLGRWNRGVPAGGSSEIESDPNFSKFLFFLVVLAQAGTHGESGHPPEFIPGPRAARTRQCHEGGGDLPPVEIAESNAFVSKDNYETPHWRLHPGRRLAAIRA